MDIKELKKYIEDKNTDIIETPLILKYSDNKFLCYQYMEAICEYLDCQKIFITSIKDISDDDFFESSCGYLYVYDVEDLTEDIPPALGNIIVISKILPKKLSTDYVEIPKLLDWQIEDFVTIRLPGLKKEQIHWLCEIAKYDVYRLDNECKKIEIFDPKQQSIIFDNINRDNGYCDLNSYNILNFINAIMKRDTDTLIAILQNIDFIDIEPTGVVTLLLQQFTSQIEVTFSQTWNESMSCSVKQFNYFKHNPNTNYTRNQLIDIYKMLTEIDYKLKSGYLDNKYILTYILNHILNTTRGATL